MNNFQKNQEKMALDRTLLANERTLLSYVRTFLSFFAMGIGLIKLTDDNLYIYLGVAFCIISPLFLLIGTQRFHAFKKQVKKTIESNPSETVDDDDDGEED